MTGSKVNPALEKLKLDKMNNESILKLSEEQNEIYLELLKNEDDNKNYKDNREEQNVLKLEAI